MQFKQSEDGDITLARSISIKICDFGVAEIFKPVTNHKNAFECDKQGLNIDNEAYHAPKVFDGVPYDATKADIWSLGMIFYECLTGQKLYNPQDIWSQCHTNRNNGYLALQTGQLHRYLRGNKLNIYFTQSSFRLLCNLLDINESQRITASQLIQCEYFKSYYQKYKAQIASKFNKELSRRSSDKSDIDPSIQAVYYK